MPDIVKKLTNKTDKNAGRHPSIASLYRALAAVMARLGFRYTRPITHRGEPFVLYVRERPLDTGASSTDLWSTPPERQP